MDSLFKIDGMTVEMEPAVTKWSFEDLGDEPGKHRWRAWWVSDIEGTTTGIELRAYPVIKVNDQSVWINESGYREYTRDGDQWPAFDPKWMKKRLLHNGSGQAWAKPTQEQAIHSIAVRLHRWSSRLSYDVSKARSAAKVLERLRPEHSWAPEHAREKLGDL